MGGALTEKVSWRWCFYINRDLTSGSRAHEYVMRGADELLSPYYRCRLHRNFLLLKLETPKTPVWVGLKAVDWLGSISIIGAKVMLLLRLQFGEVTHPWKSAAVICLIVFGIVTP